jgi:hypothetical protein
MTIYRNHIPERPMAVEMYKTVCFFDLMTGHMKLSLNVSSRACDNLAALFLLTPASCIVDDVTCLNRFRTGSWLNRTQRMVHARRFPDGGVCGTAQYDRGNTVRRAESTVLGAI